MPPTPAAPAAPAAPDAPATPALPAPTGAAATPPAAPDAAGAGAPADGARGSEGGEGEAQSFRDRFRGKVRELTEPLKAPAAATPPAGEGDGDEDDDELDDAAAGGDGAAAAADGDGQDEDGAAAKSGGDGDAASDSALPPIQTAKYQLLDAEGKPIGAAWDESVTLKLTPAGAKPHEVKSFTELADLAVRGLELRRVVADKGNELRDVRQQHTETIAQLEAAHEDTILAILFDDEMREQMQEKLAAFRDPEVRKLSAEHRKTRAAEAARAREEQDRAKQLREQLYGLLEQQFAAFLPEYPYLRPEDVMDAKRALHAEYLTIRKTQSEREAIDAAFNDTALRAAMDRMNTRLAQRLGPPSPTPAPSAPAAPAAAPAPATPDASAAAAQHNAQVEERLARKRESQSMRGAGAPPVAAEPVAQPKTFGEGRQRIKGLFRQMAES